MITTNFINYLDNIVLYARHKIADESELEEGSHLIPTFSSGFQKYSNYPKRGMAYIFNHLNFDYNLRLENRDGCDGAHEMETLKNALTSLDFIVTTFTDFTYKQIKDKIKECKINYLFILIDL